MSSLWLTHESPQKWRVWRRQLSLKHSLGTSPGTALAEESHKWEVPKAEVALGWQMDYCFSTHGPCSWIPGIAGVFASHADCPLCSGNLWIKFTRFCSFPSRRNWSSLPLSSFYSWKGKETLNFPSFYATTDKWQSKQGVLHMVTRGVMRH